MKTMNKYNIGFSIKLPIVGQQFSNLESRFDWSEETELTFDEALQRAIKQAQEARVALDKDSVTWQTSLVTKSEEQEKKLEKAREMYINSKNNK